MPTRAWKTVQARYLRAGASGTAAVHGRPSGARALRHGRTQKVGQVCHCWGPAASRAHPQLQAHFIRFFFIEVKFTSHKISHFQAIHSEASGMPTL